jgi:uncharacterized protein (TIGR02147 family)
MSGTQKEANSYYTKLLRSELEERIAKNANYSLRAYARSLGINAGALSAIMSGQRPLSLKQALKLLARLDLDAATHRHFLQSVVERQQKRDLRRRDPKVKQYAFAGAEAGRPLNIDIFHMIADWYHAAILELSYEEDFKASPQWIAKELGISVMESKAALERLMEFGLLEEVDGKLVKRDAKLELADPYSTSAARRRKQKQIRQKAIEAIDQDPVESRYMTTITMCIDPALLPEARRRIDEFNDSLCAFLESGARKQVYTMELGLFALQKSKGAKK